MVGKMEGLRTKSKKVQVYLQRFGMLIVIGAIVLGVLQSFGVVQLRYKLGQVKDDVTALETQNKILKEELAEKTNRIYVEEVARKELGLVRSGEKPVVLKEEKEAEILKEVDTASKVNIYMRDWYNGLSIFIENLKK